MVRKHQEQNQALFVCEACGFQYKTKDLAEQCEAWCKSHNSCNLEMTSQGMPPEEFS